MNKLLGFYELKNSALPSVQWKEFQEGVKLDQSRLWTIRTAVFQGQDLNLPRLVGARADDAYQFARGLLEKKWDEKGMIVYYPYFVADKSGTLKVSFEGIVVEAVKADLWNLVTDSKCDVTVQLFKDGVKVTGDSNFLSETELTEILSHANTIRRVFRSDMLEGKHVLLEWSLAYDCKEDGTRYGDRYLLFYEARTV